MALAERGEKHANIQNWEKVLLPVYVFSAYYGICIMAGLGARLHWARLSVEWMMAGVVLYIISGIFSVWLVAENKHFKSTSRIQIDRWQTVISAGPDRFAMLCGFTVAKNIRCRSLALVGSELVATDEKLIDIAFKQAAL